MFIDKEADMTGKLRRSEILSGESHCAPTELGHLVGSCYKHPAPTELSGRTLCGVLLFPLATPCISNTLTEHGP